LTHIFNNRGQYAGKDPGASGPAPGASRRIRFPDEEVSMALLEVSTQSQPDLKSRASLQWKWIALICLLLGISGSVRYLRDSRFYALVKENEQCPFPLAEFPERLGTWRTLEGSESSLEPEFAEISGAKDSLIRKYFDDKTGQTADVLILYGLATIVSHHIPGACYPAQGMNPVSPKRDKDVVISVPDSTVQARFLEEHFFKAIPGQVDYRVVYHSFLNAGQWDYAVDNKWKSFRYHPAMFKVQVQRKAENSGKTDENSYQDLLGRIVQEIDRRLAKAD
jgi:Protein of unknown function (DUF3485)